MRSRRGPRPTVAGHDRFEPLMLVRLQHEDALQVLQDLVQVLSLIFYLGFSEAGVGWSFMIVGAK